MGRPRTVEIPESDLRKMTEQGHPLSVIAAKYGCSKDCVWKRMKEAGIPRLPQHSCPGARNPAWKGGRCKDGDGYILIFKPDHPYATAAGYVREHRLVMERHLKRYLLPNEVVHHMDGDRANNKKKNLKVFASNADHLRYDLKGKIPKWTEDGKRRIAEGVKRAAIRRSRSEQG